MKRTILLVLLTLALVACGRDDDKTDNVDASNDNNTLTETGQVIWHHNWSKDDESEFAVGSVVHFDVGSDDTIYLYVSLSDDAQIVRFDPDGGLQDVVVVDGITSRVRYTMAMANDDSIWASHIPLYGDATLYHIAPGGAVIEKIESLFARDYPDEVPGTGPTQIDFTPDGNICFIYHTGDPNAIRVNMGQIEADLKAFVHIYSADLEPLARFQIGDSEDPESIYFLILLAVGENGHIYATSFAEEYLFGSPSLKAAGKIREWDAEGNLVDDDILDGALVDRSVSAFAFAPDGTLYAADDNAKTILHLDPSGKIIGEFGEPAEHDAEYSLGTFEKVKAIRVLSDGDVVVLDKNWNYVQLVRIRFTPTSDSSEQ